MLVTGQKLLASEQIKFQLFLVLCWYLETGQEIHQLKKFNENHKGKSKYLFIFIYLFIYLYLLLSF